MRKTNLFVLLAALTVAPFVAAQAQSYDQNGGYYDQNGQWHPSYQDQNQTGYYDSNGVWHSYDRSTQDGYYDRDGQWHPYATQNGDYDRYDQRQPYDSDNGYYDRYGQWHSGNESGYTYRNGRWNADRYDRAAAPDRWVYRDNRRSESLATATSNLAYGTARIEREARRHSGYDDRGALFALSRLADRAEQLDRLVQTRARGEVVGAAYRDVINSFVSFERSAGNLQPDAWLSTQLNVLFAQVGRLDHRYFGDRAFGGQNPGRYSPF